MGQKPDANAETRDSAPGPATSTDGQRQTGPRALSQTRCRPGRPLKVMFQTLKSPTSPAYHLLCLLLQKMEGKRTFWKTTFKLRGLLLLRSFS